MKIRLSIIIPCFNCETTLSEAVDSVIHQHLQIPYEVVFVDDASEDSTVPLIRDLQKKLKHSKLIRHKQNQGGGAARNTGIHNSKGELIICLDSDNAFGPHCLQYLLDEWNRNKADGVAIHKRQYFFRLKSINHVHINPIKKNGIHFEDLFNGSDVLLDNFLFTRSAFDRTGGYPVHHGFDTQGFEVRFLSVGNAVSTAKNSLIYHRQGDKKRSYFERVYESGEFSKNMFFIFEEVAHLFSKSARNILFSFDIFSQNSLEKGNLSFALQKEYKRAPETFFSSSTDKKDPFLSAYKSYSQGKFEEALKVYYSLVEKGNESKVLYFLILRTLLAKRGVALSEREKQTSLLIQGMVPIQRVSIFRENIALIGVRKIMRMFKKMIV